MKLKYKNICILSITILLAAIITAIEFKRYEKREYYLEGIFMQEADRGDELYKMVSDLQVNKINMQLELNSYKLKYETLYIRHTTDFIDDIALVYGIDPLLVKSIMAWETANFTSDNFLNNNNVCGMFSNGSIVKYKNKEQSIISCVKNLRSNYLNEGLDTIELIGTKYAPQGALNDPNNLNSNWVDGVTKIYKELKE